MRTKHNRQRIYPSSWIWPFRGIFNFFLFYRKFIKECSPEEIGKLRKNIQQFGFNKGVEIFAPYISGKRAMEAYDKKKALEDIASGRQPGQGQREFQERIKMEKEQAEARIKKQQLLNKLNEEIRNAELDRINEQDIISSIDKIKKFGRSNNK